MRRYRTLHRIETKEVDSKMIRGPFQKKTDRPDTCRICGKSIVIPQWYFIGTGYGHDCDVYHTQCANDEFGAQMIVDNLAADDNVVCCKCGSLFPQKKNKGTCPYCNTDHDEQVRLFRIANVKRLAPHYRVAIINRRNRP
jgi:rubrerythrin